MKRFLGVTISTVFALVLISSTPTIGVYAEESNISDEVTEGVYTYNVEDQSESYSAVTYDVCNNAPDDNIYGDIPETAPIIVSDEQPADSDLVSDSTYDPQVIVGKDDRSPIDRPDLSGRYRNTCSLEIKRPDGVTYIGTGFILSNNAVITAGHCVYDDGEWATSIKVYPAKYGSTNPYGYATGTSFSCGSAWKNSGNTSQDWGLIRINSSSNLCGKCGSLGLRWQSGTYVDDYVSIAGYPVTYKSKTPNGKYMYKHSGKISSNTSSVLTYKDIDTSGGESGAPVVEYYQDSGWTAIGIHRGTINGKNSAVRISEWLFNYFIDNQ
ncbi:MAG: trypsin-like serine protease [Ruminococcus sp.]|nr:trypsin-like serine protease [Ruminococcus sp.]